MRGASASKLLRLDLLCEALVVLRGRRLVVDQDPVFFSAWLPRLLTLLPAQVPPQVALEIIGDSREPTLEVV